jgi:hypothetical protein
LTKDVDLQAIGQKIQDTKEKEQKFKETMSSLPPEDKMTAMENNNKLYFCNDPKTLCKDHHGFGVFF